MGFREFWSVYLDDLTFMKVVRGLCWDTVVAGASDLQIAFRATLKSWNIPWSAEKAIEGGLEAERLGVWFDGAVGRLGVTTARLIHDASLGLFLLGQPVVTQLSLQIFGGREVHSLQSRRCLFSHYSISIFWSQVGLWVL